MPVFWLSFADRNRPKGQTFLGGTVIEAQSFPAALARSRVLGINPGGECFGLVLDAEGAKEGAIKDGFFEQLRDKAYIEAHGGFEKF